MQNFFSTERRSFLTGGGVVKNMAKNMRANMGENLERGPFGTFKGTILNGGASNIFVCIFILIAIANCLNFCRLIASLNQKHLERIVSIYIFGDLIAIERDVFERAVILP